jgi:hypothetical protein
MVTLYVGGKAVKWADAEQLFADDTLTDSVELRNAAGRVVAVFAPVEDPDWVKEITPEEIARRRAGPFLTFEEIQKQWGTE